MSIHYDLYDTPDIQKKGEEQPLHPRVVFNGTIDQEEFLDRVHKFTGISRSLLVGAMQSFQNELRDLLGQTGWIVELGDIGIFFRISTRTSRNEKERCACTIHQLEKYQFQGRQTVQERSGPTNETGARSIVHPPSRERTQ